MPRRSLVAFNAKQKQRDTAKITQSSNDCEKICYVLGRTGLGTLTGASHPSSNLVHAGLPTAQRSLLSTYSTGRRYRGLTARPETLPR